MHPRWLLASALIAVSGAAAGQTTSLEAVGGEQAVDRETQAEEHRLSDDRHQRLTVQVTVQGAGPFDFLVDTAANRTSVSRQIVDRLRLPVDGSARLHSATGETGVGLTRVGELGVSRRVVQDVEAAVLEERNIGADGVLGTDSLDAQNVTFDFRKKILSITPAVRKPIAVEKDTIVIRARRRNGRLILTDAFANGHRITVVIDTGSEVSIGNSALRHALRNDRQLTSLGTISVMSVTGALLPGDHLALRELQLGGATMKDLNILFADAHTFGQLGLDRRPALLLGMNAIRAFDKVSIDFGQKKLRLLLPKGSELEKEQRLAMR